MAFLHNIRTVAEYEAKTLRRSWFFRLFSLGALVIFTFFNIGMFSPIGDERWDMVAISSSLPLANLYLLNIAQAIVVIFLAADFLKRDKKLDTNEVLYTRSMSNFEYVIGKTWGILRLFLSLDLLILAIGLLMNIISKTMSVDIMSYIYYMLIICIPTIVFSLGLAFVLMSLIRNQAITFLILLGFAALDIFYLWFRMGSIFDYMAFGLPVFKSAVVGFDNLGFIAGQRSFFFFSGLALVLATVLLFKRLPQSKTHRILTIIFMFVFLASAVFCGFKTYSVHSTAVKDKNLIIETNRKFENRNFASVTEVSIDFIHKGEFFEASADMKILNDGKVPLDRYLFSLNPALNVQKITSAGKDLKFTQTNQIIEIDPEKILAPGQSDSLLISYKGSINESFCYPNYSDNVKENPYSIQMVRVHKRQAFLTENYVLLTPETHWYPVASLNYYPSNPARIKIDFTLFTLKVKNENGLTPVAQGRMKEIEDHRIFTSESPLTGLTLAIGNYESDTLRIDSVNYITHYFKGNDYYKKDLALLKDTLPNLVSGIMRELETNFSTKYPFKTLSLVEVPVQFYSFPKKSTQTRAEVQPSMVLLPEKLSTLQNAGFNKRFTRQKKNMARNNQVITDKELQVRLFNDFIRNTFISGENFRFVNGVVSNEPTRYRLGPSFYFFKNNFYSDEYPVINAVFESHLQQLLQQGPRGGFQAMLGTLSDNDKANLILKNISFKDLMAKNPLGDSVRTVLTVKGDWLFNLLRSKAGIEEFKTWFSKYIDDHRFKKIDIQQFNYDVKERFGFEFYPYLSDWFNGKDQPGFLITDLKVNEIVVGDRSRYQVTFIAANPEPVAGLFNISFRTGGPGGGRSQGMVTMGLPPSSGGGGGGRFNITVQGRGMEGADISRIVFMGPHEAKKIGIVLDASPRAMMINTLFAKNIPGTINIPVNEITKSRSNTKEFSGELALETLPKFTDPFEIIVDNEDPGFTSSKQNTSSPLKRLLGIKNRTGNTYTQISMWNTPEYWQPVVHTSYYGKYIRSAVYTRSGTGDKTITWTAIIKEPDYYDIYAYIGKSAERMIIRGQGGPENPEGMPEGEAPSQFKDLHYRIYHDEGIENITLDYEKADGGWNNLGRFYLSPDTAKVILTNQSAGRIVIGDAIKWVKQN
jgi:ABC-type transport system involved in multi-copper enzyme maturation permease subunit